MIDWLLLQGVNGRVVYEVVHGDRLGQFRVEPETGDLVLLQSLDREMVSSYGRFISQMVYYRGNL